MTVRLDEMDKDLERYVSAEGLSSRLGYWERRLKLDRPSVERIIAFGDVAKKHALRVASVMRAG